MVSKHLFTTGWRSVRPFTRKLHETCGGAPPFSPEVGGSEGLVHFNRIQSAGQIRHSPPTLSDAFFWYTSRSCASWNALVEALSAL